MTHKHDWRLISQGDTKPKHRPLPEGKWVQRGGFFGGMTYIPGFDAQNLREKIVEIIQEGEIPYITYQKWQCPGCGTIKQYSQKHEGITALLKGGKIQ